MPTLSEVRTPVDAAAADQSLYCLSYRRAGSLLQTATAGQTKPLNSQYDFLTFLGVAQQCRFDFFPITWLPGLENVGEGATAEIREALVDIQMSYVFKCFKLSGQD